jgi:hypothetical protein
MTINWTPLSLLFVELDHSSHPFHFLIVDREGAIANALRSGEVPIRARAEGSFAFEQIDNRMNADAEVDPLLNKIVLRDQRGMKKVFVDAEADQNELWRWLQQYALPANYRANGVEPLSESASKLRDWLRGRRENEMITKETALAKFRSEQDTPIKTIRSRDFEAAWKHGAPESWKCQGRRKM